jgi:tetratricopeptide (TPR) repeat protein
MGPSCTFDGNRRATLGAGCRSDCGETFSWHGIKVRTLMHRWRVLSAVLGGCFFTFWVGHAAFAQTRLATEAATPSKNAAEEIRGLIQSGRLDEAVKESARQLQKPDAEPNLQLLHCVAQANQNQTDKAIACFTALVKLRPDMLEAYNNLGVLHASLGQHEEAKRWLTAGIQRVPSLWVVHQNLQSLQSDLSRRAYARALQAELPLKESFSKLSMMASTPFANPVKMAETTGVTPASLPGAAPVASVAKADNKPVQAEPPATKPESKSAVKPDSKPETKPDSKPESSPSEVDAATGQLIQMAVESWAKAWSAQNMTAYFAAYSPEFTPYKLPSRAAWEAERTARIVGRKFIRVSVRSFSYERVGPKVVVKFSQIYESDNISSTQRKRLDMVLHKGRWKIARENIIAN